MLRFDPFDVPTARARTMRVFQVEARQMSPVVLAYTFGLRSAVITALVMMILEEYPQPAARGRFRSQPSVWFNTRSDGSRFSTDQKERL